MTAFSLIELMKIKDAISYQPDYLESSGYTQSIFRRKRPRSNSVRMDFCLKKKIADLHNRVNVFFMLAKNDNLIGNILSRVFINR